MVSRVYPKHMKSGHIKDGLVSSPFVPFLRSLFKPNKERGPKAISKNRGLSSSETGNETGIIHVSARIQEGVDARSNIVCSLIEFATAAIFDFAT